MTLIQIEPSAIKLWTTAIKKVYVGSTQVWPNVTPVTTRWIYHNPSEWLISLSSNGSTRYTIADKNYWATTVWNTGDSYTTANGWNFFLWWNKYAFPWISTASFSTTTTRTDVGEYWPSEYSGGTWISVNPRYLDNSDWQTHYKDLWWWVTDTNAAKKWPCATWFHVPTLAERTNINTVWANMWAWNSSSGWSNFTNYLKIPPMWIRNWSDTASAFQWAVGIWTATTSNRDNAKFLFIYWTSINLSSHYNVYYWMPIRPFKDVAVQPDSSWTVLYQ